MLYISKMRLTHFIVLGSIFLFTLAAEAKMISYVDKAGEMHYVNTNFSKVPPEYQDQVEEQVSEENNMEGTLPEEPVKKPKTEKIEPLVEVLVTLDCPDCRKLELLLNAHKVTFHRYDVMSHPYGKELYEKIGGNLPITKIGDQIIYGIDIKRIVSTIQENKKETAAENNLTKTKNKPPEQMTNSEEPPQEPQDVQEEKEGSLDAF